ncbi:MAG: hypothetical protein K2W80_10360, partial [Burkholderiales bacterium]|nr:hypothetical protein [Burkholderiales bacterium]
GGQPEQGAMPPPAEPVEPVAAGIPRTPVDDAESLLGDADAAAALADLGVIMQPDAAPVDAPAVEKAAPKTKKKKQSKEQRRKAYKDANQFKSFLSEFGVRADLKLDVMGDKKAPNPPVPYGKGPVFRKNGMNLDELASYAMQRGFITEQQMEDPTDNGAVRLLADMIRRQMNQEGNLQTIEGIESELDRRMDSGVEDIMREAWRRDIETDGRSVVAIDEDVKRAQARDLGVDPDGLSVDEVAEEIEQAEVNRLLEEAAEGGGEVLLDALAVDPDGRIALAMLDDDGAVERASRDAEDDVDFLNRIEDIIRGSGRTDANAAADTGDRESRSRGGGGTANAARAGPGGATAGDNADGAGGNRASGAQESDVSSSGRESGEARADADRQPDGARRQDSDGVDQDERAGAESDRARGRPEDGSDQGRDGASTADAEGGSIGSRIRAEIGRLASPKSDAESAGFELQGETSEELIAKAAREARVKAELDAAERKARKKEKAADDAKSDKRQADATVDDFKLGQDAQTQMVGPGLFDADPLANNYAALEGKTVVQTIPMDGGKSATLKMDAAKALRGFDDRLAALKALGECVARPK